MRRHFLLLICASVAWVGGTFLISARQPDDPLLDHDEVYWIGSAYYYDLAFVKRDWTHEAWRWLPARENPPVSKYVIGLGLAVAGHHITTIDSLSYFYLIWLRWERSVEAQARNAGEEKRAEVLRAAGPSFRSQILENKRAPLTRPVVRAARNTILVCAALGSLGLFVLGILSGSRLAGLIASQLFLVHPVAASAARHAMSDTIAAMFSIAAAVSTLLWYRRFSAGSPAAFTRGGLGYSFVTGVSLGLACGAKMSSLVIVLLTGIMVALVMGQRWALRSLALAGNAAVHGIIVLLVGVAVFTLINPAILNDFPGGLAATITEHRYTEATQVDLYFAHPVGIWQKLDAVVYMAFQGWTVFALMVAIVLWSALRQWDNLAVRFAVCWWLLALVCVTQWLPFAWPRYTMPLLPPSLLLVGNSVVQMLRWFAGTAFAQWKVRTEIPGG
jgi:hypothetical protein